jgi:hypothetical protein
MDMYERFGEPRYLEAVGKAVDWFRRSRIGGSEENGIWARFYEVETNRPLYFTKTYELVYTDDDLPVHYSFQGNYGVNRMMARYESLRTAGPPAPPQDRTAESYAAEARKLAPKAEALLAAQDELGRWVKLVPRREEVRDQEGRVRVETDEQNKLPMMYSRDFVRNINTLASYLVAVQGGPAIKDPNP